MTEVESSQSAMPEGLSQPAMRALDFAGNRTLESVAGASQSQLLALHGVGPKAIRTLQEALESRGLPALTE
ncbi:MAG TPA: hypothetical protein VFP05_02040 [Thermomicrobiales bacterium]|nr:hypothetical protein [Thermomicrobiales bacterium]